MAALPPLCHSKYQRMPSRHTTLISIHAQIARKMAALAVFFTLSGLPSPSAREMAAFNPTALPRPSADTIICTGAASESAVSASSATRETKTESTKLYSELMRRLSINGIPVVSTSRLIFCVPILFSDIYLRSLHRLRSGYSGRENFTEGLPSPRNSRKFSPVAPSMCPSSVKSQRFTS